MRATQWTAMRPGTEVLHSSWRATPGRIAVLEVQPGARRRARGGEDDFDPRRPANWNDQTFRDLDRNRDGILTRAEFTDTQFDDDRDDRFDNLDVNGNGRTERSEWHGSVDAFDWLDRNNDNVLSGTEGGGRLASVNTGRESGIRDSGLGIRDRDSDWGLGTRARGLAELPTFSPEDKPGFGVGN